MTTLNRVERRYKLRSVVIYEKARFRYLALEFAKEFSTAESCREIIVINLLPSSTKGIRSKIRTCIVKFWFYLFNFFFFQFSNGILTKSTESTASFSISKHIILSPNQVFEYQFDSMIFLGETRSNLDFLKMNYQNVVEFRFPVSYPGLFEIAYQRDFIALIVNHWVGTDFISTRTCLLPTQATYSRNKRMIFERIEQIHSITFGNPTLSNLHRKSKVVDFLQLDNEIYDKKDEMIFLLMIKYASCIISELVKDSILKLRPHTRKSWHIALSKSSIESLTFDDFELIANPSNGYYADPFLLDFHGEKFIFCEEFNYKQKKGSISAIQLSNKGYQVHRQVIEEPFHLSYPFPFKFENRQYICPESGEAGELRIYQSFNSPLHWELISRWITDKPLYDPQIFEYANVWWLLATAGNKRIHDFYSELVLFWSDNPINGTWKAHPLNPICIDSMRGRNAGFICRQDKIFRVAQRYGFRNYGAGFAIFEINELSKESYAETFLVQSDEIFTKKIIQSHHVHENSGMTVFDFKEAT